jgi:hypothetical protein
MILLPCGDNLGPHRILEVTQPHTQRRGHVDLSFLRRATPVALLGASPPSRDVARDILLFLQLSHGRT